MLHRKNHQPYSKLHTSLIDSFQLNYHRGLQLGKAKILKNLMALHAQGLAAFTSKSESYWNMNPSPNITTPLIKEQVHFFLLVERKKTKKKINISVGSEKTEHIPSQEVN